MLLDRLVRALAPREIEPPEPVPEGVAVRRARWLPALGGRLAGMRRPAAAVTIGRTIVVHPDARLGPRLLRHELAHVRQWSERPLLFPVLYAWCHLRHGYRANPYEVQAREAERGGGA